MLLAAALCLAGCAPAEPPGRPVFHLGNRPPQPKDVIEAVMAISRTPLTGEGCSGAGTELTDTTIGRYLAGFLAELSSQEHRNAITTEVEPGEDGGQSVYVCRLMVRHAEGEDVWSWGLQFSARRSDGAVLPDSIRCLGGG